MARLTSPSRAVRIRPGGQKLPVDIEARIVHELGIAGEILNLVEKVAGPDKTVAKVHLTLGPLSGVSADALRFCFTEVAQLRRMGAPELVIEVRPAEIECCDCGATYQSRDFLDGCPKCHSMNRRIHSGREFTVDWVELDDEGN